MLVVQSCLTLRSHGLWPTGLLCPWNSPGKNTGVGCHFLLQGTFPTHGSNLGRPHCRQSFHPLTTHLQMGRTFSGYYSRDSATCLLNPIFFSLWMHRDPTPVLLPGESHGWRSLVGWSPWGRYSWTRLSDFTFTFHFYALEKEMATHSSVLAWRIPGTGELGGLPSMGLHRVGHD